MGAQLIEQLRSQRGMTLIEVSIATGLLLVAMVGLLSMAAIATTYTENHGHLEARTTEYAQDKMEQLLALKYGDTSSNTAVFPATSAGGTGLAVGGSSNPEAPAAGYIDWLDVNGNLLAVSGVTAPAGWFYKRVWQVAPAGANLEQVTVTTIVAFSMSRTELPRATVAAVKTFPF